MKELLLSLLRHALIALVTLGGFLSSRGMIAPEDATAVNAAGVTLREALAVVLFAVIMRLILRFGGKVVKSHKTEGTSLFLLLGVMAGLVGTLGLSSCTPEQREVARSVPIKACYSTESGGRVCYSSKGGIEVDYRSGK